MEKLRRLFIKLLGVELKVEVIEVPVEFKVEVITLL